MELPAGFERLENAKQPQSYLVSNPTRTNEVSLAARASKKSPSNLPDPSTPTNPVSSRFNYMFYKERGVN